jgi:hypothetical protein
MVVDLNVNLAEQTAPALGMQLLLMLNPGANTGAAGDSCHPTRSYS